MRRREFIAGISGSVAACPFASLAQTTDRPKRIAVLVPLPPNDADGQGRMAALRKGLKNAGWMEGQNIAIEIFWSSGGANTIDQSAANLVMSKPDLIVASASPSIAALMKFQINIPIVFAQVTDPVSQGFVTNLARPGGNITGFGRNDFSVANKWVEILLELSPSLRSIEVIFDQTQPTILGYTKTLTDACSKLGVEFRAVPIQSESDVKNVFAQREGTSQTCFIVLSSPSMNRHFELICNLAKQFRIPIMYEKREFVSVGALMSYGVDNYEMYQRSGDYIDKILKGAKPGDLPVQLSSKFGLAINIRAANDIGLNIPLSLTARADEVIE